MFQKPGVHDFTGDFLSSTTQIAVIEQITALAQDLIPRSLIFQHDTLYLFTVMEQPSQPNGGEPNRSMPHSANKTTHIPKSEKANHKIPIPYSCHHLLISHSLVIER